MERPDETIADIIAWLRKPIEGENGYLTAWRDEIADRLEAAHRREMSKNVSKNGADFGQLGDAAKLREALEMMNTLFEQGAICTSYANSAEEMEQIEELYSKTKAALSNPPRNCDVGTAREQEKRHKEEVCPKSACPKHEGFVSSACKGCFAMWSQMPYEEGGAK